MAEAARREDIPDRESLRQAVVEVERKRRKMLYLRGLERRLLMGDIALIELAFRLENGRRDRAEKGKALRER